IDGHCPHCGRSSTFKSDCGPCGQIYRDDTGRRNVMGNTTWNSLIDGRTDVLFGLQRDLVCARNQVHILRFWINAQLNSLTKVGQDPSLADIARDASKTYRSVLSKQDSNELHK